MSAMFLLKDAIGAVKDKAVSAASTATSEDLAYIASALEKIGGNASLIEIDDYASNKVDALQAVYDGLLTSLNSITSNSSVTFSQNIANMITAAQTDLNARVAASSTVIQSQINLSVKTFFIAQF